MRWWPPWHAAKVGKKEPTEKEIRKEGCSGAMGPHGHASRAGGGGRLALDPSGDGKSFLNYHSKRSQISISPGEHSPAKRVLLFSVLNL